MTAVWEGAQKVISRKNFLDFANQIKRDCWEVKAKRHKGGLWPALKEVWN